MEKIEVNLESDDLAEDDIAVRKPTLWEILPLEDEPIAWEVEAA